MPTTPTLLPLRHATPVLVAALLLGASGMARAAEVPRRASLPSRADPAALPSAEDMRIAGVQNDGSRPGDPKDGSPVSSPGPDTGDTSLIPGVPAMEMPPAPPPAGAPPAPPAPAGSFGAAPGQPGYLKGLMTSPSLLGNLYGGRDRLAAHGISLGLSDIEEVFDDTSGGLHRGLVEEGLTYTSLGVDLEKAVGWSGAILNASAFQIHGRGPTQNLVGATEVVSSIEAVRATRLWELWLQQSAFGGRFDAKIGQQSLDQEFIGSVYGALFVSSAFGWPALTASDLYAGGPAFPLASLGVRLRGQLSPTVSVLGGVFDDNPVGGPFGDDPQSRGAAQSGTAFPLGTGALFIGEVQYAVDPPPADPSQKPAPGSGLPGIYKLGGWFDSGAFPDQRFAQGGLAFNDPAARGLPVRQDRQNFSLYATADQMIYRPDPSSARMLGLFLRAMAAPRDRNPINLSLNGGIVLKAPFEGRDGDSLGIGFGYAHISGDAAASDADNNAFNAAGIPVRTAESFVEITYQAQVMPWWQLQPDFQYLVAPQGGVADPNGSGHRLGNAALFGLRTSLVF